MVVRRTRAPFAWLLPWSAVIVLVVLATMSGCADGSSDAISTSTEGQGSTISKMAIITPEPANDFGWNQQGVEAATATAAQIGAELEVADGAGYEDITPLVRELHDGGAQWILAWASGYGSVASGLAQELDVPVVVIGAFEEGLAPGLSADLETHAEQGAYLAGVMAARMSKAGTLGIVMSADDENWVKMAGGFSQGAQDADPEVRLLLAQIGQAGYADAAGGKRVTESVIAGGADIIFGMGDGSTFGMIQAVETAAPPAGADKVWFIDVIGDKRSIDEQGVLLTSVLWDYEPALLTLYDELQRGGYGSAVHYLDLAGAGITLLQTEHIPAELWAELEQVKADIVAGTVIVQETTSKAAVEDLLD